VNLSARPSSGEPRAAEEPVELLVPPGRDDEQDHLRDPIRMRFGVGERQRAAPRRGPASGRPRALDAGARRPRSSWLWCWPRGRWRGRRRAACSAHSCADRTARGGTRPDRRVPDATASSPSPGRRATPRPASHVGRRRSPGRGNFRRPRPTCRWRTARSLDTRRSPYGAREGRGPQALEQKEGRPSGRPSHLRVPFRLCGQGGGSRISIVVENAIAALPLLGDLSENDEAGPAARPRFDSPVRKEKPQ
jgi:hypothetical protein